MKQIIKVLVVIGLALVAYIIGMKIGEMNVINNQIVANESKTQGMYEVEYKGTTYYYWYE